jgi:hypothetical protein
MRSSCSLALQQSGLAVDRYKFEGGYNLTVYKSVGCDIVQPMNKLLPLQTRVHHSGHGAGTIVAYNGQPDKAYALENLTSEVVLGAFKAGLGQAIVNSFYGGDRYPYVIQFDSGYKDVYALDDVTEVK